MSKIAIAVMLLGLLFTRAQAQDVPGIEICTAEKNLERRTSCLQSNINFLMQRLSRLSLENQQKIDITSRQVDALKATVVGLQKKVDDLQAEKDAAAKDKAKDKAKDAPKEAPKDPSKDAPK
jgi:outer membrane murein-binding lipoprotein Lpp